MQLQSEKLAVLFRTLEHMAVEGRLNMSQALIMTVLGAYGPVTQKAIQEYLGMPQASVSRVVLSLSAISEPGTPGLGFVETFEDLADRRTKLVRLTPEGQRILNEVEAILVKDQPL